MTIGLKARLQGTVTPRSRVGKIVLACFGGGTDAIRGCAPGAVSVDASYDRAMHLIATQQRVHPATLTQTLTGAKAPVRPLATDARHIAVRAVREQSVPPT